VHGLTVGPTLNPFGLSRIILFNSYDLPVRYIPATVMTLMGDSIVDKNSIASSFTSYMCLLSEVEILIRGIASSLKVYFRSNCTLAL